MIWKTNLVLANESACGGKSGNTPLLVAASNAGADAALVQLLVDSGADIHAKDETGRSVVDLAGKRTDLRAAEVLALFKSLLADEK